MRPVSEFGMGQLPALPQSMIRLLEVSQEPAKGRLEFAASLESDSSLTGQVLKFVNSSYFGFARKMTSIKSAIKLVGIRTIKNFAIGDAILNLIPTPKYGLFDLKNLWQDSLRRALFARAYAELLGIKESDEQFTAALLQDMAMPLLANEHARSYVKLLEGRDKGNIRLSHLEKEAFGWTHSEAAGMMARQWNLPESFATMIESHHAIQQTAANGKVKPGNMVVALSALLPTVADPEWCECRLFEYYYVKSAPPASPTVIEMLTQIDEQFINFAPVLKIGNPGKSLVQYHAEAAAPAAGSGRNCMVGYQAPDESGDPEIENGLQADRFNDIEARLVMTPIVVCLREEETISQAAEFFLRSRVNSTPVIDEEGKLAGILSEKDLMTALNSPDYWQLLVRNVMEPNVITYEEDTPVRTIYDFLCRASIRRVVIVKDGRPTGSISRATLLRWYRNMVIGKGLVEHACVLPPDPESDPHRSKERLIGTARQVVRKATELLRQFHQDDEDLLHHILGGVTSIQELAYDLLAYSRYATTKNISASIPAGTNNANPDVFHLTNGDATSQRASVLPLWNPATRVLRVGGHVVKQYRVPSPAQESILAAFHEEGWPTRIDDPLPPAPDGSPKDRLRSTIRHLNSNQKNRLIRFRGDGTGQGILWELINRQVPDVAAAGKK